MATEMSFKQKVTKNVKPSLVKIHLSLSSEGKNQEDVVKKIKDQLEQMKKIIENSTSYKAGSFTQNNLSITKDVIRRKNYKEIVKGYRSYVSIYATLVYGDTVVKDLLYIINYTNKENISLKYDFEVDHQKVLDTYEEIFAEAVNECYDKVNKLTSKINPFSGKTVEIKRIDNYSLDLQSPRAQEYAPAPKFMRARNFERLGLAADEVDTFSSGEEPVAELISEDMIESMFNNSSLAVCEVSLTFEVK